ncbi:MAG: DUF1080 domain-containing protein [Pirellulales bacterium]
MKTSFARCLFVVALGALTLAAWAAEPNTAPPAASDAEVLFNGKDLTGWDGDTRLWSVKDGVIHGETTKEVPAKGNTFLILKDRSFKDFDLRLSFRCNATNNSGIMYRSKRFENKDNKWIMGGYQHELRNETKLPNVAGFIYDERGKRARINLVGEQVTWKPSEKLADGKHVADEKLITAEEFTKLFKLDDWNDVVIVARGNNIKHYLNGRLIVNFTDEVPELTLKDGLIGLQLHAGAPMWAEFKNISIKEAK